MLGFVEEKQAGCEMQNWRDLQTLEAANFWWEYTAEELEGTGGIVRGSLGNLDGERLLPSNLGMGRYKAKYLSTQLSLGKEMT